MTNLREAIELPIANSKRKAIIDAEFYPLLSRHRWFVTHVEKHSMKFGWVATSLNGKILYLHSMVMGAKANQQVDHINRNTLDNRVCNLRFASLSAQAQNKCTKTSDSKYKGVKFRKNRGHWFARIMQDKVGYHLGAFDDETGAAWAYDMAAYYLYGENAFLNFRESDNG